MKKLLTIALAAISCSLAAQELTLQPSETELVIHANGVSSMTALQFNLELPDGSSITNDATLGTATDGHTLSIQTLDSGDLLFILYSMNLNTFKDGELLRIPINIKGDGTVKLHKVRFADTNAVSYAGKDAEEILTGISSPKMVRGKSPNDEYFDLSGRRVSRMTKGIYIVGGRKVAK